LEAGRAERRQGHSFDGRGQLSDESSAGDALQGGSLSRAHDAGVGSSRTCPAARGRTWQGIEVQWQSLTVSAEEKEGKGRTC